MNDSDRIVVFITAVSVQEAQKIAGLLLSQKNVACVNIVSEVESLFWWKGKIESAKESLMIIKTKVSQLADIVDQVKRVHSYEVPEIIAMPIIGGSEDYLKWLDGEVEADKPTSR